MSAMAHASLRFGIEIELLLGGRKKAHSSWKSLANDVSRRLAAAGVANHINDGGDKAAEHYREYSIVREVTIPNQLTKGLWGIELVSPVYPATWHWAADMELIFSTVRHYFVVAPSPHCSTHIHVSGTPLPLSPAELSALAKAALYFEAALDQLVPAERRASAAYWCQSNRDSVALRPMGLRDCMAAVEAAPDVPALVGSMNLCPAASSYGRAHGKKHDFVRGKVFKWDFSRMLPRSAVPKGSAASLSQGTVEFRQPYGSRSAEDAKGWIALVLALVAGATRTASWVPLGPSGTEGADMAELWALVVTGASVLGWDGVGDATAIFSKRSTQGEAAYVPGTAAAIV